MAATAKPIITKAEGLAIGAAYIASLKKCFSANDFSSQHEMMADRVSWDWSGGVSGEGSMTEYYDVLAGSWQAVVSHFCPTNMSYVVDGEQGIICISFEIVLIIDGRGAVPITKEQVFTGRNLFELHVNAEKKITKFRGLWDPQDSDLGVAMGNVMKAFGKEA